jgi:hypothetical protein
LLYVYRNFFNHNARDKSHTPFGCISPAGTESARVRSNSSKNGFGEFTKRSSYRAALTAKRANGAKLGNPTKIVAADSLGRGIQIATADEFVASLMPVVDAIRSTGANTLEAISKH